MVSRRASYFRRTLLAWYRTRGRNLPWRRTRDPYAVLISELMLQQQTVVRVVPVYEAFMQVFPTLEDLAAARRSEVLRVWSAIGLNTQAVRAQLIARTIVASGGVLPRTKEGLLALPGVGPYTAAAVLCFAFGERAAMVDTNIRRVLSRVTRGSDGAMETEETQAVAAALLPRRRADAYDWNQGLMDLGATVCRARAPRCGVCPVERICEANVSGAPANGFIRERREGYRASRQHEGSTRQLRGLVVRLLAAAPEGAALTETEMRRAVTRRPEGEDGVRPDMSEALEALVGAGVVTERRASRRVARYSLGDD